jgi:nitrogen fixation/metabolism regulation signal transduction histidine kinase
MTRHAVFALLWLVAAALVVGLVARELSRGWFLPGLQPEIAFELDQSLADQRELAKLTPDTAAERRRRFERTQALAKRLRILSLSREGMTQRHLGLLLAGVVGVVGGAAALYAWRQAERDRRLGRLHAALRSLAQGEPNVRVADPRRDVLGRVARMVEQASDQHTRDRRRLASLEDLSRWQEAAKRHAHEMRTPLSAARLDLGRLRDGVDRLADAPARDELLLRAEDVAKDLTRLGEFARAFADFGRLPLPSPSERDVAAFAREFAARFATAWPGVAIAAGGAEAPCPASVDAALLEQVLVNLCENSAAALRDAGRADGRVDLAVAAVPGGVALEVRDDGPGLSREAHARLFQPYATFRVGGTGLGLAISRKILLDHGGDLEWVSSEKGAAFRLFLPHRAAEATA